MAKFEPIMVGLSPEKEMSTVLKMHKADFSCMRGGKFDLTRHLLAFQPTLEYSKQDSITLSHQVNGYESVMSLLEKDKAPLIGISSTPDDSRAKQLALHFMEHYLKHTRTKGVTRKAPYWHRVFGGYKDSLVEDPKKIGFLVISNFNTDSTPAKLEKVRDLIEMYHTIPVVLVMSGTDPISLVVQRLRHPLTHAFYIGSNKTVHRDVMEILDV